MSDPEVPKNEQPKDVEDVVGSANEGLDAAAAARADVPGTDSGADDVDPDHAAFEAAERDFPGTFTSEPAPGDDTRTTPVASGDDAVPSVEERPVVASETDAAGTPVSEPLTTPAATVRDDDRDDVAARSDDEWRDRDAGRDDLRTEEAPVHTVADDAYAPSAASAETRVLPAEPTAVVAPAPAPPQPIFVQAPEPPRELGNRGTAGAIGLVATVAFAVLYLGAILGIGALAGDVTLENIGTAALAPLTTWSFWVPVAVFFLSFWLLGAFVNRARWGKWVTLGLLVALATYGGHLLGQLFQAPFWRITPSESAELIGEQLWAPLAIAAFVFARELTIWFGAWVARSGARKKALNAEAQAEYERTLEAGPSAMR
ncbi:ABC transporter [Microbacterium sp. YJN-G]|uniref:ABC transporter n=1 Tax=Microbacterium sp. YJN-G TaxID=2763257 RepID=UPI0018782967|nr:ABC transporter [Microbacterium sp. YJN-G]